MTTSYERGRFAEYTVKRMLEGVGYRWIIRSAVASNGSNVVAKKRGKWMLEELDIQ
jgi:hypothetical protein